LKLRNDTKSASEDVDRQTDRQTDGRLTSDSTTAPTVVLQYKSEGCGDAGRSNGVGRRIRLAGGEDEEDEEEGVHEMNKQS
jgi:hypothetical protein